MQNKYTRFFSIILFLLPAFAYAQTWKPIGYDEKDAPSLGYTSHATITTAPDGTPYIAFNDETQDNKITVKRFNGSKWITVGAAGFSEGYYASDISLAFIADGTPYISYAPTIAGQTNFITTVVRKLSDGAWVKVGSSLSGNGSRMALSPNGLPYIANNQFGTINPGVAVAKFLYDWKYISDTVKNVATISISGSNCQSSDIISASNGIPYIAYVAAGDSNRVSVKKLVAGKWQLVGKAGFTNGADSVSMVMATDGGLFVAYKDSTLGGKAMVKQYKNGDWVATSTGPISIGTANYLNMGIAPDNTPYVIFCDQGNGNKATVKKLIGGKWINAGSGIISTQGAGFTHIAIGSDGTPYAIYSDYGLEDYAIVKKLSGNQWTDVGEGDLNAEPSTGLVLRVTPAGDTYAAFNDADYSGRVSVKQYLSGKWQYRGQPGISPASAPQEFDMTTSPEGIPFVFYGDSTQHYMGVVKKFTGTWTQLGGVIGSQPVGSGTINSPKIVIAHNQTPYVVFTGNQVIVEKYTAGAWGLVGNAEFSTGVPTNLNLAIDTNNIPYVAYIDALYGKPTVKKFNGSSWVTLGTENFTTAKTRDINLTLSPDGTPYLAYFDFDKNKIAVEAYKNNNWVFIGQAASDSIAYIPKLIFDGSGQPYLACVEVTKGGNDHSVIKKLSQNSWIDAGDQDLMPYKTTIADDALAIDATGDLVYAYLSSRMYVRTKTSDDLGVAPTITGCSPLYGITGTTDTISGFNFNSTTTVKFGQSNAASFKVTSPTTIIAVVGPGASGLVSVTTAKGTGTFDGFTYGPTPPVIKSFSPLSGDPGAIITIKGENFSPAAGDNTVHFGSVTAIVSSANDSTLLVKVPPGSTYQPISVTTRQLTAYSTLPFNATFKAASTLATNSFATKQDYPAGQNASSILITDIDSDGRPDVAAGLYGYDLLRNTSTPQHILLSGPGNTIQSPAIAGADFDGDGRIDLAYTGNLTINNSSSNNISFLNLETLPASSDPFSNYDLALGDLDGDGRPDIVTADGILKNAGTFQTSVFFRDWLNLPALEANPNYYTLADLDGDGKPDLMITMPDDNKFDGSYLIIVLKNTSTPESISFVQVGQYSFGHASGKVVMADVDNDGKLDMIVPNTAANTVTIYRNTSTNTISFAAGVDVATGSKPMSVCFADLDGDGKVDMAVANSGDNTVSVLKNNSTTGNIAFAARIDFATGKQPYNVAAVDMDGDGAPELITANMQDNSISVLRNNLITFTQTPVIDFKIAITSVSCKGSANGAINITAPQAMSYTATISGNNLTDSLKFTTTAAFSKLTAGTYHLCFTIEGQANYQQCNDVVITEPKDLSLYSTVNYNNNTVVLSLSGGSQYNIQLNGALYTTSESSITLPLNEGTNNLAVTTDRLCQGTIIKALNVPVKLIPYPVPFQNTLSFNLGDQTVNNLSVKIYTVNEGKLVYSNQYNSLTGILQLDVAALSGGVYFLHLDADGKEKVFKIFKK